MVKENLPALPEKGGHMTIAGFEYEHVGSVTRTVLRQEDEIPFFVEIQSPIRPSQMDPANSKFKDAKTGEATLPDICEVINLETGEFQILVCNVVLASELKREFPDDGYVGKQFAIKRGRSEINRRYKVYTIIHIRRKGAGVEKVTTIDGTTGEAIDNAQKSRQKKVA